MRNDRRKVEYTDVELAGSSGFWVPGFEFWNIQVELVQNKRETGNPKLEPHCPSASRNFLKL